MTVTVLALRFILATLFLAAGLSKLVALRRFERSVAEYKLLPAWAVGVVARLLPPLEIICGAMLAVGILTRLAAVIAATLLLAFVIAVGLNLFRGRAIACGCFGDSPSQEISWWLVARDSVLAACATTLAVRPPDALSPIPQGTGMSGHVNAPDAVAVLIASTGLFAASLLSYQWLRLWKATRNLPRSEVKEK